MSTVRQKNLAKVVADNSQAVKPLNKQTMLEKVGYATTVAEHKPKEIFESKGLKEELRKLGFDSDNAKAVVAEILNSPHEEGSVRLNAAKEVFKVNGDYAAEKSFNLTATASVDELKSIIQQDLAKFRPNK